MKTRGKRLPWQRIAGTAIIAGAAIPVLLRWLKRTGTARRMVDVRMTVVVERRIHEVFEFCRDFANFPDIMDTLLSVEDMQDGRSHWAVRSPTGHTIEWDATVTKYVPNSVIAWESVAGSPVTAKGLMRFAPLGPEETRVDITVSYHPQHTDLIEALRALVSKRNSERLRVDVANVSRELARGSTPLPAIEPMQTAEPPTAP